MVVQSSMMRASLLVMGGRREMSGGRAEDVFIRQWMLSGSKRTRQYQRNGPTCFFLLLTAGGGYLLHNDATEWEQGAK